MKLRKHYEPEALATWTTMVARTAAKVKDALRGIGVPISDSQAQELARGKHETERQTIPITHMEVIETGQTARQVFADRFIERGQREGWVTISGNRMRMRSQPDPLTFTVLRTPGYYCKSSGDQIPLSERAAARLSVRNLEQPKHEADAWLKAHGKDPADYEVLLGYEVELDEDAHEKWRAVRSKSGHAVAAHTLEG